MFFFEPEKDSVFFAPQGTNEHVERLTNRTKTPFFLWEVNPEINRFSQDNKKKYLFSLSSPPFESEITCLYLPSCHGKALIWRIKTVRHFALPQKSLQKTPSPLEDSHELCTFVVKTHHPLPQPLRRVLRLPI